MKPLIPWLIFSALGPVLASWVVAQGVPTAEESPPNRPGTLPQAEQQAASIADEGLKKLASLERATSLLGKRVMNLQQEEIGEVKDLVFNLATSRVTAVIVSSADYLRVEDELNAIPPSALRSATDREAVVIDIDKEVLERAPRFPAEKWPDLEEEAYLESLYRAYQVEPYFRTDAAQDGTTGNLELGVTGNTSEDEENTTKDRSPEHAVSRIASARRASELIGLPVNNSAGENVGSVTDLVLDLSAHRLVGVVVSTGNFLNRDGHLSVVPGPSFSIPASGKELRLDMSREALAGAPRFAAESTAAGGTGEVETAEDQALSRELQKTIDAAAEGADLRTANSIVVTAKGGQVTLTGTVVSDEVRQRALKIARDRVGTDAVEDQMIVSGN